MGGAIAAHGGHRREGGTDTRPGGERCGGQVGEPISMDDGPDYDFTDGEKQALADLRSSLKQVAEWPLDSPLGSLAVSSG